jgi:hypothetical protein
LKQSHKLWLAELRIKGRSARHARREAGQKAGERLSALWHHQCHVRHGTVTKNALESGRLVDDKLRELPVAQP